MNDQIKLDPTILAIALLNRQCDITTDDCSAHGCAEAANDICRNLRDQARLIIKRELGGTDAWDALVAKCTLDDLNLLAKQVDEIMPNPFTWKPPEGDYCSCCGKGVRDFGENPPQGWKRCRPLDPEDGPEEWRFHGQAVICNDCHEDGDMPDDTEDHGPCEGFDTPEYEAYCLRMTLLGGITRDW